MGRQSIVGRLAFNQWQIIQISQLVNIPARISVSRFSTATMGIVFYSAGTTCYDKLAFLHYQEFPQLKRHCL
jgi:hypothetical protein